MGCCWWDRAWLSVQRDRSLGALLFVLSPSAVSQLVSAINGDLANLPLLGAAKRSRGKLGKTGGTFKEETTPLLLVWPTLCAFYRSFCKAAVKMSLTSWVKRNNWCVYVQVSQWQSLRSGPVCDRLFWSSPAGGDCCCSHRLVETRFLPSEYKRVKKIFWMQSEEAWFSDMISITLQVHAIEAQHFILVFAHRTNVDCIVHSNCCFLLFPTCFIQAKHFSFLERSDEVWIEALTKQLA